MTTTERDYLAEINDPDEIVMTRDDLDEVIHEIEANADVLFTWDYERSRPALVKLYEKAKTSQWNGATDLPWDTDVDPEKMAYEVGLARNEDFAAMGIDFTGTALAKWGEKEWLAHSLESNA